MRDTELVLRKVKVEELPKDSELKNMSGSIHLLGVESVDGKNVIVKDGHQVMVPRGLRKEIMHKLHATHMAGDSMVKLARKSLFWPKISTDLKNHCK